MITWSKSVRAAAALTLVAGGIVLAPGAKMAHAAANCLSAVAAGTTAVDPFKSQIGDFGAAHDGTRPYGEISGTGICVNPAAATIASVKGSINEASFTITLSGAIPTFPSVPQGDVGMELNACVDISGPLGTGIVQVSVGHRGGPIMEGPLPASQGYKYCAWASMQAGLPNDWGWSVFVPEGIYNQTSHLNAHDTSGVTTITPPTGWAAGSSSVTLFLPDVAVSQANAVSPPLTGLPHNVVEPFLGGFGAVAPIHNIVDVAQVQVEASLPFPICVNTNPPGITCNGNETLGPEQGIVGLLVTTSWAPGAIQCATAVPTSCAVTIPTTTTSDGQTVSNGSDLGIVGFAPPGVPGVGLVSGQAIVTCVNPLLPGVALPPANNAIVTCAAENGTYTYNPCQTTSTPDGQDRGDLTIPTGSCPVAIGPQTLPWEYDTEYGRIYGFTLGKIGPLGFYLLPTFLPSGWGA